MILNCNYCGAPTGSAHTPGCAVLASRGDPYGVPTGVVPRVPVNVALPKAYTPRVRPDPIAQAVDDYLMMERKARAWDELRAVVGAEAPALSAAAWAEVEKLDRLVHPAQTSV
jgi:hypothetical protein